MIKLVNKSVSKLSKWQSYKIQSIRCFYNMKSPHLKNQHFRVVCYICMMSMLRKIIRILLLNFVRVIQVIFLKKERIFLIINLWRLSGRLLMATLMYIIQATYIEILSQLIYSIKVILIKLGILGSPYRRNNFKNINIIMLGHLSICLLKH